MSYNSWTPKQQHQDLPLYYKDKPSNSTIGTLNSSHYKRKMLFKGFVLSLVLYLVYIVGYDRLSWSSSSPASQSGELTAKQMQDQVKSVFLESWNSYKNNAWGKDVYHPTSKMGSNMGPHPLGWMIVDSLDTLMIMQLDDEVKHARDWVTNELSYDFDYNVNTFETTIRMLGGFLSAYYLSKDDVYLDKAVDLGNRLLGAFDSTTGIPYASINLKSGQGIRSHSDRGASSTAEVATLQLEFKYLAKLTGESLYWEKVEKIMSVLDNNMPTDGLVPIYVQPETGLYQDNLIRLGSRGDSYYEYLLKQYLQTNQEEPIYNEMYTEAIRGVKKHMTSRSHPNKLTFIGELEHGIGGRLSPKMDHLVCFMGGLLALGSTHGLSYDTVRKTTWWSTQQESDLMFAKELTYTCYKMYHDTATGLAPEIVVFNTNAANDKHDFIIKPADTHNLQRPETVESLYVLYKITKDPIYRKWGWEIFQNFQKHTKVVDSNGEVSYVSLDDVTKIPPTKRDNMESFWLAETLKYLYLLFEDDDTILPLDEVVFNTEAHPLPKFELGVLFKTGWERLPREYAADKKKNIEKGFKANTENSIKEEHKKNEPVVNIEVIPGDNNIEKSKILADKDSIKNKPNIELEKLNNQLKPDLKNIPQAAEPDKSAVEEAKEEAIKDPTIMVGEDKGRIEELLEELEMIGSE